LSLGASGAERAIGLMASDTGFDERVVLAVPTFGRRVYLKRCLESIGRLIHPEGVSLYLLLLDNNPGGEAREIYDEICPKFDFPTRYVHVKEQGIPFVRNRALDEALALRADFIGFLDDDEEAPPQWMLEAFNALRHYGGDVVSGPKARILPEGSPDWMKKSRCLGLKRAKREGHANGHVSTSNVIFRSEIAGEMGLRFREEFNTTASAATRCGGSASSTASGRPGGSRRAGSWTWCSSDPLRSSGRRSVAGPGARFAGSSGRAW